MKLKKLLVEASSRFAFRMSYITNSYRIRPLKIFEEKFGLLRPEVTVLFTLAYREGINQKDICEISGHAKNNISRAVISLEKKGLIALKNDSQDARRKVIYFVNNGKKIAEEITIQFEEEEKRLLACLNQKELAELDKLLNKMADSVEKWVESDSSAVS